MFFPLPGPGSARPDVRPAWGNRQGNAEVFDKVLRKVIKGQSPSGGGEPELSSYRTGHPSLGLRDDEKDADTTKSLCLAKYFASSAACPIPPVR